MTREQMLDEFDLYFSSPYAKRDGNYLAEQVLHSSRQFIRENRTDLVSIVKEWLGSDSEPYMSLGLVLARELKLVEVKAAVLRLKNLWEKDQSMMASYSHLLDGAIAALG